VTQHSDSEIHLDDFFSHLSDRVLDLNQRSVISDILTVLADGSLQNKNF
jgi:hypothetical protein